MSLEMSRFARKRQRLFAGGGIFTVGLLITLGVFAANDWFPKTDALTGKKTGGFGNELPKHATSAWNPFTPPPPTPQLSKEYLYAGQRLLAVEDANATVAPPADIAVWRGSNGNWMVMGQTGSAATTFSFGLGSLGDVPLVGDYDGDGKTDFSVFRPGTTSTFYVWPSGGGSYWGYNWGGGVDKLAVGDFDGDGKTDYAIARPDTVAGTLTWWVTTSSNSSHFAVSWGTPTDELAVADYDGDGKADVAVFRSSDENFYIIRSSDLQAAVFNIGETGTVVSSDFDGDGKADPAIYVSSTATWYIRQSTTNSVVSHQWGSPGNIPVHNDYDLDGKTDLAVWNNAANAQWTIKRSSNGTTRTETFGTTGDIPVPAFYRR
ncbi:MAG: FG-GAP repeat domain-containing protein [Pyrinomonadaceae bacterium]